MLRRFAQDESGNIIAIMGVSTLTLLGAVSAGLDYSRMTNTRASLAAAADAAALAAAQAPPGQAAALARQVFDANFRDVGSVASFNVDTIKKDDQEGLRVEASANVEMTLTRVMGYASRPVRSVSEVMIGADEDIQVALVLDVTGSMAGQKMADLKTSAASMVNTLYDKLKKPDQVKMAVVPFAEYVNVGLGNRYKPWISVPPNSSTTQNVCWWTRDITSTSNCRMETHTWTSCNDGVCTQHSGTWQVCDHTYGPWYQTCQNQTHNVTWAGCVGSRDYPLNVRDENYTSKPVPGVMNVHCPAALTPLSTNRSQVLSAISSLAAGGETYIPAGLMWGWAALSPGEPFDEPTNPNRTVKRVLVLMTDGENTRSPTYPRHDGGNANMANGLTAELCGNIKSAGVEVFTIAFQVNTNPVKNLLRNCATTPDNYYDASDSAKLASAFDSITKQMSMLRLTK